MSEMVERIDFERDGESVDDLAISGDLVSMVRLERMSGTSVWGAVYMKDGRQFTIWLTSGRSLRFKGE